nr:protein NRT1/ PTR FAMILY 6.3-like [Ipomoea batatas]
MASLPHTRDEAKPLADAWDFKGRPALRSSSGGWIAAAMILGVEACERLTTLGIGINLVTYLTGTMHLGNAGAANVVTNFLGASFMLTLLGGFVADTFLGRYLTIGIFTTVQAAGVTILTISTIIPSLQPPKCSPESGSCVPASGGQLGVLYLALYLTALGTGGLKSSVSGLGTDQFDDSDKRERGQMVKFFSWFIFFINVGSLLAVTMLVYIQDNVGRRWGYGLCACAIVAALVLFLAGTRRYRFKKLVGSPMTQIASVYVAAWRKRRLELPSDPELLYNVDDVVAGDQEHKKIKMPHSKEFRFLDRAAIKEGVTEVNKWSIATLTDVEEVKQVIRMLPTWATTIMFWTIHAQLMTFSVAQAATMDRHMGKSFEVPAASMAVFYVGGILVTIMCYDRIMVPIFRRVLNNPQGLSPLQRIAIGLALSVVGMMAAALVEIKRLRVARSHTLDKAGTVPMSVFWLAAQYLIVGSGEALTYVGQLDFFLRECPKGMKTMSTGLFLSTVALGLFFSSVLVTIVDKVTVKKPWLADHLNQGKLYDFYWLLAIMSALNLMAFLWCTRRYVYKEKRLAEMGIELEEETHIAGGH